MFLLYSGIMKWRTLIKSIVVTFIFKLQSKRTVQTVSVFSRLHFVRRWRTESNVFKILRVRSMKAWKVKSVCMKILKYITRVQAVKVRFNICSLNNMLLVLKEVVQTYPLSQHNIFLQGPQTLSCLFCFSLVDF